MGPFRASVPLTGTWNTSSSRWPGHRTVNLDRPGKLTR